jgi:hypothetical protein
MRTGWMPGVLGAFLLMAWLSGCSKPAPKVQADTSAFDFAPPEVKSQWTEILAAAATNGYATVILDCRALRRNPALTPEQRSALNATSSAVQNKMFEASQKGDPAAAADVDKLRKAL